MESLALITHTVEGYEVKGLRFKSKDNIIVGRVKDPLWGKETLHDGWISGTWYPNGAPYRKLVGREDLRLLIPKI